MTDVFTKEKRKWIMSRVGGKNTAPEKIVRYFLHSMGYRFRLHRADLPGKPDIILPRYGKIIFVHGCFWHGHIKCSKSKRPTTNEKFWNRKLDRTIKRDKKVLYDLKKIGWKVLVVWECETRKTDFLIRKLRKFINEEEVGRTSQK